MSLHAPLTVKQKGDKRFAVSGLVADCVYFGLFSIMPQLPDLVVSGINRGPNLGSDVIYSGTVAGAREAAVRGICGIALSLAQGQDFTFAAKSSVQIVKRTAAFKPETAAIFNINFPEGNFSQIKVAPLGRRIYPEEVHERKVPITNESYYWLGGFPVKDQLIPQSDGYWIKKGVASLTPLVLDQTNYDLLREERLKNIATVENDL
jgi:5'-nucleotidase